MKKELYEKLDYDEKVMYRIESNTLPSVRFPYGLVNMGLLAGFVLTYFGKVKEALGILKIMTVSVILLVLLDIWLCTRAQFEFNKEWEKIANKN